MSFRYEYDGPLALEEISFTLRPGCRIAVVGPSGAGKSTLVDLALRFWDPKDGHIKLGGQNIRGYAQDDLRREFGVVSQDTHVFNDTLRGNLLLARPEATDGEIEHALAQAQLLALVRRSSKGLDSPLGEQGLALSGGERQRLAVARTFLKGAPLLLLDEPTANLDPITERELLDTIYRSMRDPAVLIVTHRLVRMEEDGRDPGSRCGTHRRTRDSRRADARGRPLPPNAGGAKGAANGALNPFRMRTTPRKHQGEACFAPRTA